MVLVDRGGDSLGPGVGIRLRVDQVLVGVDDRDTQRDRLRQRPFPLFGDPGCSVTVGQVASFNQRHRMIHVLHGSVEHVVFAAHAGDSYDTIDIPAGDDNARADGYYFLRQPAQVVSFQPHLHNRGKRQCVEAIYPSGLVETLSCAQHNFAWMLNYTYAEDVQPLLPAGTNLHLISWYDNSEKNRYNPDPRNWIGFGNRFPTFRHGGAD